MKKIRILCISLILLVATTVGVSAFSSNVNKEFIEDSVYLLKERIISDGYYSQAGQYTINDTEIYSDSEEVGFLCVDDYGNLSFRYYYNVNGNIVESVIMDFDLPYSSYISPDVTIFYESPYYLCATANFDASEYEWDDIVSFSQTEGSSFSKSFVNEEGSDVLSYALAFWNGMLLDKVDLCLANIGFSSLCTEHDTDLINVETATCENTGYTGDEMCFICGEVVSTGEVIPAKGHRYGSWKTVTSATCTTTGKQKRTCTVCKHVDSKTIAKLGHNYSTAWTVDKKASKDYAGSKSHHCKRCDVKKDITKIAKIKSIKLSKTTYVYNGDAKSPAVVIKNANDKTISSKNYTVTKAKGRTKVGKYSYKIVFKNEYKGTKTLYFKINPKSTKITSLTKGKKSFTVKWSKKTTQTTGYQIYYSTSKTRTNGKKITISKNTTTSKKISNLKSKKKYYVWVRTYKTVDGKKYYSSWSDRKYVTTK